MERAGRKTRSFCCFRPHLLSGDGGIEVYQSRTGFGAREDRESHEDATSCACGMKIYKVQISKDTGGLRDDAKNAASIPKHNVYILLMKTALRIFYGVLALLCTVAVCVLAYFAIFSLVKSAPSKGAATVAERLGLEVVSITLATEISGLIRRNENARS